MHEYKSLSVLAIDSGKVAPHCTVRLVAGRSVEAACGATKTFGLEELSEIRDLIDWAAEAYAQAFEELHEDGWKVTHSEECPEAKGFGHVEA